MNAEQRQTILIVDDEAASFAILSQVLKDKYRVLVAKNGEQALKIVDRDAVDCILLDILMPGMDGYEVLRRLKNSDHSKDIAVILTTAKSEDQDEGKGLHLGAVDYIRKPFNLPIVEARVRTHLELRLKNRILTELVSLDGLTNIYNRRKFDESLTQEFKRNQRAGLCLGLLLLDVDHFKPYNDNYGHAAGDACLRRVASCLKGALKRPGDFLARYGGQEFVMLLPDTDSNGLAWMAQNVQQRLQELHIPHEFSPTASCLTLSIGGAVARAQNGCKSANELLQRAGAQLCEAKNAGRNTFRLHQEVLAPLQENARRK